MEDNRALDEQLAKIRTEVQRSGGVTVQAAKLALFCPDHLSVSQRFRCIAEIAQTEGWSFAFLRDGSVQFGSYS